MTGYDPDLFDTAPGALVPTLAKRHKTALVYPPAGYDRQHPPDVLVVAAGQITETQISLGASVKSIQQPVAVKDIKDESLVPDFSCYVVSDVRGNLMDPKVWRLFGGKIKVRVNRDTVTATVTIYGPTIPSLGPFTIGFDNSRNTFAGLFLLGDGVGTLQRQYVLETGLQHEDEVTDDSTPDYDNPYLQTREQAYDAAHEALCRKLGDYQIVTITVTGVRNLDGVIATAPETSLGKVAGARLVWDGLLYRVRSAVHSPAGIELTCVQDVTFGDIDDSFSLDTTMADITALWPADSPFRNWNTDVFRGGDLG